MRKILFIFLLLSFVINVKAQNPTLKSITVGKKLSSQCVACHGDNGISVIEEAPNLAGQKELYIWNQLRDYKSGKRQNEIMNIIAKNLTDDEMNMLDKIGVNAWDLIQSNSGGHKCITNISGLMYMGRSNRPPQGKYKYDPEREDAPYIKFVKMIGQEFFRVLKEKIAQSKQQN